MFAIRCNWDIVGDMGRAPMPRPSGFSLQVIEYVRDRLADADADLSGRYLAKHTTMSSSYARERLIANKPFNTSDIEQLTPLFGFDNPAEFIAAVLDMSEGKQ